MRNFLLLCLLVLSFAGCAPPYRQAFDDAAQQNHWTKKQELAAFAYADRIFWARETAEGSGQYVISYGKVPTSKIREQVATVLTDFDQMLDPRATDNKQYVDMFNLRKDLEHDEAVAEAINSRVVAADLDYQFKQDMGEAPTSGPEAELGAGYSVRKIFLAKDIATAFPFKSDVIEAAKKNGTLKLIQSAQYSYDSSYDHKDVDPANPDDANEFVWKPKHEGLLVENWKIIDVDKPTDNKGNYIEAYRVYDANKIESNPCLKIFFPSSGAVVLIDVDRQGEPGYGVPDILEQLSSINNVNDVITNSQLLSQLFAEKKTEKRALPPANQLFKIEISRLDQPTDPWETNAAGYSVPFKYRTGLGDNYNVRIKYKAPKIDPNYDPEAIARAHGGYLLVDYIEKEYTKSGDSHSPSTGQVIEYYHPKEAFAVPTKAQVLFNEDTKKVSFVFPDGSEVDGFIPVSTNKFIEDSPYAISYSEGQKRWYIEQHDAKVYNRRKLVAPPKEATGDYSNPDSAVKQASDSQSSMPGDDDLRNQ